MTTANAEQFEAWNGESGRRWVAGADSRDAVLAPVGDALFDRADIEAGERVLDIGCGCGATTVAAVRLTGPTGAVTGVDLSAPMLEVARVRARAAGHDSIAFEQLDAQTDPLGGPFDVAISRFGTMFFADPVAAFANVARHLDPGGRVCVATWQPLEANEWLVVPGAALAGLGELPAPGTDRGPGMFSQSSPDTIGRLLGDAGFTEVEIVPSVAPLTVGPTIEEAVGFLAESGPGRAVLEPLTEDRRDEALAAVRDALAPHHRPGTGVVLGAAVWITTALSRLVPPATTRST